jgi:hypothetical protein
VLQTKKKNGALWLTVKDCPARDTRHTETAIEMLFLTPGSDSFFEFRQPRFQWEERDLVREWLPAIFNQLLLEPGRHF